MILLAAALGIGGCGAVETENPSDEITLLEPVNANANTEKVMLHNLYDYEVEPGYIYPKIKEYSFLEDTTFFSYVAAPGTEVSSGSVLAKADAQGIEEQIKRVEEQEKNLTETYEEEYKDLTDLIKEQKELIEEIKENQKDETEEEKSYSNRQVILIENDIRGYELSLNQNEELYALDADYYEKQLEYLHREQKSRLLYSDMNGMIVNVGFICARGLCAGKKVSSSSWRFFRVNVYL